LPTITRFEDIQAWQTARTLTQALYRLSNQGSFARDFGLRDQMRRAAVSILSNIAEGFESDTQAQFIRYLGLAKASAGELRRRISPSDCTSPSTPATSTAASSTNSTTRPTNAAASSATSSTTSNPTPPTTSATTPSTTTQRPNVPTF
jgi:four helix bundle protein